MLFTQIKGTFVRMLFATVLFVCSLLAQADDAAPITCKSARNQVERMICRSELLSSLDQGLNFLYQAALKRTSTPEQLRQQERDWLVNTRNICTSAACLKHVYRTRIRQLTDPADDVEGVYFGHGSCVHEPWRDADGNFIGKLCDPPPVNTLFIEHLADGRYRFEVNTTVFATGNFNCAAEGFLKREDTRLVFERWDVGTDEFAEAKCPLTLTVSPKGFTFHTQREQCGICGQNGNLNGEFFPRPMPF